MKNWVMHLDRSFVCFTINCLIIELFFNIKEKKISKIQLRKLGQSTSVYRYFYAILQRAALSKGTKPNQQTNKKNNSQISRTSELLTLAFSFILLGAGM